MQLFYNRGTLLLRLQVVYSVNADLSGAATAKGTSDTYGAEDLCGPPANITSQSQFRSVGFLHTAVMTGLQPATQYYYRYGNDEDGWSKTAFFTSRPAQVRAT